MTQTMDTVKRSVTAGDYADNPNGAIFFAVGSWSRVGALPPSILGMPLRESDWVTLSTPDYEALWAGALSIAVTKVSSLSWEVNGDVPLRNKRSHDLLTYADAGRGWVSFISKLLQDFLLTNNGCFIEIVRQSTSLNSQIIGLIPLDSMRCTRTGDPEIPVTYQDLKGAVHQLRAGDVLELSDMPSSRASMFGAGKCAAARSYTAIYKLAAVETYIADKVTGRRPLAINLVHGVNAKQLEQILDTAQSSADARGVIAYMGAILAAVPGEAAAEVATVPLADFPDVFDRKEELDISVLTYADNIGLDPQDLQPLTGQALGTGAQSIVLEEKAKGKGLAAFRQQFVHLLNTWVLPDLTTMAFIEKDWRDKKARADVNNTVVTYTTTAVEKGVLGAEQALQALVDEDVYPEAFLDKDITPDVSVGDIEKPDEGVVPETPEEPAEPIVAPAVEPAPVATEAALKKSEEQRIVDETLPEAEKIARKIMRELGIALEKMSGGK